MYVIYSYISYGIMEYVHVIGPALLLQNAYPYVSMNIAGLGINHLKTRKSDILLQGEKHTQAPLHAMIVRPLGAFVEPNSRKKNNKFKSRCLLEC